MTAARLWRTLRDRFRRWRGGAVLYVDPENVSGAADDDNPGSPLRPLRTMRAATAWLAGPPWRKAVTVYVLSPLSRATLDGEDLSFYGVKAPLVNVIGLPKKPTRIS